MRKEKNIKGVFSSPFVIFSAAAIYFYVGSVDITHNWKQTAYNDWRLLQIFTLFVIFILCSLTSEQYKVSLQTRAKFLISVMAVILVSLTITITIASDSRIAFFDFAIYLSLVCYTYLLYKAYSRLNDVWKEILLANFSLTPTYFIVSFLIGSYLYFTQGIPFEYWRYQFENIRYYDDTLLPFLFLLWYQPGYLKRLPTLAIGLSALYLLTLLLDGARANLLGVIVGLSLACLCYKQGYKKIVVPLASICLSIGLYGIFLLLEPISESSTKSILRGSSSGRWSMWIETFKVWLDSPILGIGGGNFIILNESVNLNLGHPHNIVLQLLVEWGLVGLIVVGVLVASSAYVFLHRDKVSPILFAGTIALGINMLLSGAHVYPSSQMSMAVFFSVICYQLFGDTRSNKLVKDNNSKKVLNSKLSFNPAHIGLCCMIALIVLLSPTIFGNKVSDASVETSDGPRFWIDAYSADLPEKGRLN